MRIEAQNYFDMMVTPTCEEFFQEPWSLRRGALALIAVNHLVDYYAMENYGGGQTRHEMQAAVDARREVLAAAHPHLTLIRDAADAIKHGRLASFRGSGQPLPTRAPGKADDLMVTPGMFRAPFGTARFAGAMDIYFDDANGQRVGVRQLLRESLQFWQSQLGAERN